MEQNKRMKTYAVFAWIFGGVCLVALVWLLILLGVAGWQFFAIDPVWMGFLLMTIAGFSMAVACVFVYLLLTLKQRLENTVICPSCGKACDTDNRYCSDCGTNLPVIE
jgi:uncharacterized membrane protein